MNIHSSAKQNRTTVLRKAVIFTAENLTDGKEASIVSGAGAEKIWLSAKNDVDSRSELDSSQLACLLNSYASSSEPKRFTDDSKSKKQHGTASRKNA